MRNVNSVSAPGPAEASGSLLARTLTGAGWIIAWRFASRFIGLGSTLVLVRLLTPADFGIAMLATSLIQGMDTLVAFGVDGAIIRLETIDSAVYDAGFTINVARGAVTGLIMAAAAVPVSHFFHNQNLVYVLWVLAGTWVVRSFQNIGMVEYRRRLDFDMEFKVKIVPRLLVLGITIPTAAIWHSYWALVAGTVANNVLTVMLSYVMHPYRPRFGIAGMRQIFAFSFWEWIIGLLWMVGGRIETIIIGRLLGMASIGIYETSSEIASLPSSEIVDPLCRALFSGFAEEQRSAGDGSATMLRVLSLLALITFPFNVGLSLVAEPVVRICFGKQWLAAVPLIQLLGIALSLRLFQAVGEALFSARAWLKPIMSLVTIATIIRLILMVVLIPRFGLIGAAIAGSVVVVAHEASYVFMIMRRLRVDVRKLLTSVLRPAVSATAMAIVLNLFHIGWSGWNGSDRSLGFELAGTIISGAGVYIISSLTLWFAAGLPAGPEADALAFVRRVLRR